jgi:threonine/homoserine/homoserine lactone efflux protein
MTLNIVISLIIAMLILAIVPGPAVFAVVSKSISSGFTHGLFITIGIVLGDFIFILLAIFGLTTISGLLGNVFFILKYLGAIYLICLGVNAWKSKPKDIQLKTDSKSSLISNFLTGLFITLGNPKAILFYISFFPAFIELNSITTKDILIIMFIATITIGGINIVYAYTAHKAKKYFRSKEANNKLNKVSGSLMVGTGVTIILKS